MRAGFFSWFEWHCYEARGCHLCARGPGPVEVILGGTGQTDEPKDPSKVVKFPSMDCIHDIAGTAVLMALPVDV